jgi:hypothetical protein
MESLKRRRPFAKALLAFVFFLCSTGGFAEAATAVHHRLEVELSPAQHKLVGRDRMRIRIEDEERLSFHLSDRATALRVSSNGVARPFRFSEAELAVPIDPGEKGTWIDLDVRYESEFKDPVPLDPANTDSPGYGVTASIGQRGTFLLSGAGWYPELGGGRATYSVRVQAPEGIIAVTAGKSLGHKSADGATVSEWLVEHPVEGLSLSAAAYEVHERLAGPVTISLYLLRESRGLAPAYLEATEGYIRLYTGLFGPYPFPKFAVVENFFPTGYGFPSYTLLGSSVLRLPFIVQTSLGHEIAHSWWGNGVHVDYEYGNWAEGLTSYVADHLYEERRSPQAAEEYRLQAIRNYSALVPQKMDFPLSEFSSRTDPLTKAIGYDKGTMVFHMLRKTVGEESFWSGLRDLSRERLFRKTSWKDLQETFEKRANRSLQEFFVQWVYREGAPRIRLQEVRARTEEGRRGVEARIVQEPPHFEATVSAALECAGRRTVKEVRIAGHSTPLEMECRGAPERLTIDPHHDLLRRLDPSEIPPAVNLLKRSPSVLLVISGEGAESMEPLARTLALSLGLDKYRTVSEKDLQPDRFGSHDIILVGLPSDRRLWPRLPAGVALEKDRFTVGGRDYGNPSDVFFGVFRHPSGGNRVLAVFHPLSGNDSERVVRKVPHYGRYSYLAFRDGVNQEKGLWPVDHSPLLHEWKTGR